MCKLVDCFYFCCTAGCACIFSDTCCCTSRLFCNNRCVSMFVTLCQIIRIYTVQFRWRIVGNIPFNRTVTTHNRLTIRKSDGQCCRCNCICTRINCLCLCCNLICWGIVLLPHNEEKIFINLNKLRRATAYFCTRFIACKCNVICLVKILVGNADVSISAFAWRWNILCICNKTISAANFKSTDWRTRVVSGVNIKFQRNCNRNICWGTVFVVSWKCNSVNRKILPAHTHIVWLGMIYPVNISSVSFDELIKRVADISVLKIWHLIHWIGGFHCTFINGKQHICLMIQLVWICIHFVAGINIKLAVKFNHAKWTCIKRYCGVWTVNFAVADFWPAFWIFYNPYNFCGILFAFVLLTENNIIVILAREITAVNRKLLFDCWFWNQGFSVCGILFNKNAFWCAFNPCKRFVAVFGKIWFYYRWPGVIIVCRNITWWCTA